MKNNPINDIEETPSIPIEAEFSSNILMRLIVGSMRYLVIEVDGLTDENGDRLAGRIDHSTLTCEVEKDLPPQAKRYTIWYQAIHAFNYQAGIDMPEEHINNLAYGIMLLLQDNPELRSSP